MPRRTAGQVHRRAVARRRAKRFIRSRKRRGGAGSAIRAGQLDEARKQAHELIQQSGADVGCRSCRRQKPVGRHGGRAGRPDRRSVARKDAGLMCRRACAGRSALRLGWPGVLRAAAGSAARPKRDAEQGDPWIWWKWANFAILAVWAGLSDRQERAAAVSQAVRRNPEARWPRLRRSSRRPPLMPPVSKRGWRISRAKLSSLREARILK